jgi:RNA polymerase sigma-70 factor (ECF subfamily)
MNNLSEKELVVLAQGGNVRAISALIEKYRPLMVKSMAYKFKQFDKQTVEDVVQEAMIKVYSKISTYKPSYSFNTWVHRIVINKFIDEGRKSSHRFGSQTTSINEVIGEGKTEFTLASSIPTDDKNPQEAMEKDDRAKFAHSLLNSNGVSEGIKIIAKMRYLDEMSYDEIVAETNLPLGTIKAQLHRFRQVSAKSISKEKAEDLMKA